MKSASFTFAIGLASLVGFTVLAPRTARADDEPPATSPPPATSASTPEPVVLEASVARPSVEHAPATGEPRYDVIRLNAGVRMGYVTSGAFDTFADSDVLTQFSVDGTYPLLHAGRFVLGAGLGWDYGGRSDGVRGVSSEVKVHRMYVPIEGRLHFAPWIYGFGKIAPGAAAMVASVTEGSSPRTLDTTGWAFSGDLSIGASILMGPRQNPDKRAVRFWITPELGYAYTTGASIRPTPGREDKDLLGSDESTALRSLALSGFFWRATVGTTF